jgi:hypothetical protein
MDSFLKFQSILLISHPVFILLMSYNYGLTLLDSSYNFYFFMKNSHGLDSYSGYSSSIAVIATIDYTGIYIISLID